jgi:hypothetical protein
MAQNKSVDSWTDRTVVMFTLHITLIRKNVTRSIWQAVCNYYFLQMLYVREYLLAV